MRRKGDWFLGIDLGTGSCKAVIVNEDAEILGIGVQEYVGETTFNRWQEQNVEMVLKASIIAVRKAMKNARDSLGTCKGLSLGGALHTLIAIDRLGRPLTGIITWADSRANEEAKAFRASDNALELYEKTGCPPHPMYPLYKILWLKEKRWEVFKHASRFVSAKEYIFSKLTGEYVVDYCVASGSGLLNIHSLEWDTEALDFAHITRTQLSTLSSPQSFFPLIDTGIACEMGIPIHTPCFLGSADAVNSSIGAGAVYPFQVTCMVGTSGAMRVIKERPITDKKMRTWCYAIDRTHWLVGGAINNGGITVEWLRSLFGDLSFEEFFSLAERARLGAQGLICLPFFAGERSPNWNLNARAVFFGLSLRHKREDLARALLEGIGFRLKSIYDVLIELGFHTREVRASGGFTQSSLWLQIITDILDRELIVPKWTETSALGASFWALLGKGVISAIEEVERFVKTEKVYKPNKNNVEIYRRLYKIYEKIYDLTYPFFDEIASLGYMK